MSNDEYEMRSPYPGEAENRIDIDYGGEFGPELSTVIPYAYYLSCHNRLGSVTTSGDMECFYFFCSAVDERYTERSYLRPDRRRELGLPNIDEHTNRLDLAQWIAPPYRSEYENQIFRWSKPTLVISNKYNIEWGSEPVNFINLIELEHIFDRLIGDYQIVYNRPLPRNVTSDNSDTRSFADHALVSKYSDILTMQDLHDEHPEFTFNELQMRVYANCQHFISVQGGNAVLASYFGGVNVVKVLQGKERRHGDYLYFPEFAGTTVLPCASELEFRLAVESTFSSGKIRLLRPLIKSAINFEYRLRSLSWPLRQRIKRCFGSDRGATAG